MEPRRLRCPSPHSPHVPATLRQTRVSGEGFISPSSAFLPGSGVCAQSAAEGLGGYTAPRRTQLRAGRAVLPRPLAPVRTAVLHRRVLLALMEQLPRSPNPSCTENATTRAVRRQPGSVCLATALPFLSIVVLYRLCAFLQLQRWRSEPSLHHISSPCEGTRSLPARALRQSLLPPLLPSPECCCLPCSSTHWAFSFFSH